MIVSSNSETSGGEASGGETSDNKASDGEANVKDDNKLAYIRGIRVFLGS
jgi:hypothetical protein